MNAQYSSASEILKKTVKPFTGPSGTVYGYRALTAVDFASTGSDFPLGDLIGNPDDFIGLSTEKQDAMLIDNTKKLTVEQRLNFLQVVVCCGVCSLKVVMHGESNDEQINVAALPPGDFEALSDVILRATGLDMGAEGIKPPLPEGQHETCVSDGS